MVKCFHFLLPNPFLISFRVDDGEVFSLFFFLISFRVDNVEVFSLFFFLISFRVDDGEVFSHLPGE